MTRVVTRAGATTGRPTHCVVTGANTGIGLETARALARTYDVVTLACRDETRARAAMATIGADDLCDAELRFAPLDLSSLASIEDFGRAMRAADEAIDAFVANAGVMALPAATRTRDGFETQVGVNHLGHYAAIGWVFPLIERAGRETGDARVVVVSSEAHRIASRGLRRDDLFGETRYGAWTQYGQSKLANVLFANELARRCEGRGVTVASLHPGAVDTELGRYLQPPDAEVKWWQKKLYNFIRKFLKTPEQGAATSVFLARDIERGVANGKYFSDCREKTPAKTCLDEDDALWLWNRSAELTGVAFDLERV